MSAKGWIICILVAIAIGIVFSVLNFLVFGFHPIVIASVTGAVGGLMVSIYLKKFPNNKDNDKTIR